MVKSLDTIPPAKIRCLAPTLALSLLVVGLDQAAKYMVRFGLFPGELKIVIPSFFNLTYVRNTGAVWGWFQNQNEWLVLISIIVLGLIAVFYYYLADGRTIYSLSLGCIVGGIIGNLIDRIKLGWVTDFLDFYVNNSHWPSFNVADSAICIGAGLYLLASLWPVIKAEPGRQN